MEMIQTYQGYFQDDGRFIADGILVKLPAKRRAIVNIIDDEATAPDVAADEKKHRRQAATVKKFLADVAAIKNEDNVMTDADWDELANIRSRTNNGFARTVEI